MDDKQNQFRVLWAELRETLKLNLDYARLTAAEKLTMLITTAAIAMVVFVLLSLIVFFVSLAIARWIATGVGMIWAYFIMGGFYMLLIALVLIFRKQLVVNPISRFVSRLFLNP